MNFHQLPEDPLRRVSNLTQDSVRSGEILTALLLF